MTGHVVEFLTQERRTRLEKAGRRRPVGLVANAAILGNRLMVMDERAAFFHVAGVARLVSAALGQMFWIVAMHIVTRRAVHFAFNNRMVRWLVDLSALLFVAGKTGFGLRQLTHHPVVPSMNLMA